MGTDGGGHRTGTGTVGHTAGSFPSLRCGIAILVMAFAIAGASLIPHQPPACVSFAKHKALPG